MTSQIDQDREVIIKLKAWQIPYLVGSARLGMWVEDWCAGLVQTSIGTFDTHSQRWIYKVCNILDQIKKQTEVKEEDKEYAEDINVLLDIEKWVNEECTRNDKFVEEYFKKEAEKYKEGDLK